MDQAAVPNRWTALNRRKGVPPPSSPAVGQRMRAQRRRDTACEWAIRRELHARGLRYRLDRRPVADLRRRADIVFPRDRVAVFVDGCFWHGCPEHARPTRTNTRWWDTKIRQTQRRDRETTELLEQRGFTVVRVWEHENPSNAAEHIESVVRSRRS